MYVPEGKAKGAPLFVALHGCRQDAEDFAYGTRFDVLGARYGAIVLYPEQDERANGHRCWNWFLAENQRREGPEPSAILEIVEDVIRAHDVDRRRVFVAGLSAGASMAAILAEQAPDVFSAAALMAGVALHAASDESSAYAAMRGDVQPGVTLLGRGAVDGKAYASSRAIVWTGVLDRRVDPINARRLAEQFRALYGLRDEPSEELTFGGKETVWCDDAGRIRVVLRELPGVGHAWSGGSLRGSYTAPAGPKFSEAAFRFFLEGS